MSRKKMFFIVAAGLVFMGLSSAAMALPQFARKYNFDCSTCHWPNYPKLNKFGYEFRAAGYRSPSDIGKTDTDKFDWETLSSIKVENSVNGTSTNDTSTSTVTNHLEFSGPELDIMPMTGSFGGNWASSVAFMLAPGMTPEIERAYLRYVAGDEKQFFTVRAGIFDPFEGYGASDATILLSSPLALTSATDMIPFTLLDGQYGLEVGYTHEDTRLTLGIFNGLSSDGMGGGSGITGGSDHNEKDVLAYLNQFIGDDGVAFSGYFYNGYFMGTQYQRGALFATVPLGKSVEVLVGGESGQDSPGLTPVTSVGGFGEIETALSDVTTASIRYDYFNKDDSQSQVDVQAGTLGLNVLVSAQVKWSTQYQLLFTDQQAGAVYQHGLQTMMTFIY